MDLYKALTADSITTVLIAILVWYIQRLINHLEKLTERQNEFNAALVRIETKVVTEIENLKALQIQHDERIFHLEKNNSN